MTVNQDITAHLFPEGKSAVPFFIKKTTVWSMLGVYVVLTVILYILTMITMDQQVVDLYDRAAGTSQIKQDLFLFLVLGVPVLGLLVSLPVSVIPYRNQRYKRKYLPFAIIAVLGIDLFLIAIRVMDLLIQTNKK